MRTAACSNVLPAADASGAKAVAKMKKMIWSRARSLGAARGRFRKRCRAVAAPPRTVRRSALHARLLREQPRLPARDLDFGAAAQLHMQPSADADLDFLDEREIEELAAV